MAPLIQLKQIKKIYQLGGEDVHALNGIDLNVHEGDYLAIMGTSGSGKSTLMNIIGCLDLPTSGEYILDGRPVHHYDGDELADVRNRSVGFIFQQFNLLPQMNALHNVMLPLAYAGMKAAERQARAEEVLQMVGLGSRMHHKPSELSGGQQQRVSIARALANHPKLLLADEPTGALDSHTSAEIMNMIDDFVARGTTVIVVTHDAETARRAGRIVHVRDGEIIGSEGKRVS